MHCRTDVDVSVLGNNVRFHPVDNRYVFQPITSQVAFLFAILYANAVFVVMSDPLKVAWPNYPV